MTKDREPETAPKGWFTLRQLAEKWGCTQHGARHRADVKVKSGEFVGKSFRVSISGRSRVTQHYTLARLAKAAK